MLDHTAKLYFTKVDSIGAALCMKRIRNECREFMTRDTNKISIKQQRIWYEAYKNNPTVFAFLARLLETREIVGYCLVRNTYQKPVISGGLKEKFRGRGLGYELFAYITEFAQEFSGDENKSVYLEVLESNIPAQKVYRKIGYREEHKKNGIIHMIKI